MTDVDVKVLDHCHYTGKFLGNAHNMCVLKRGTLNFHSDRRPQFIEL